MLANRISSALLVALTTSCGERAGAHSVGEVDAGALVVDGGASCAVPDSDGDGFASIGCGGLDCDDFSESVSPSGLEVCNGRDDDCDGELDEQGCTTVVDSSGSCALLASGEVICWEYEGRDVTTFEVGGLPPAVALSDACAATMSGEVFCWCGPEGEYRFSADPDCEASGGDDYEARQVPGVTDALTVDNARSYACAVTRESTTVCWGENTQGQLGRNSYGARDVALEPMAMDGLVNALQVQTSDLATCVRTAAGQVFCAGDNSVGLLGQGDSGPQRSARPIQVAGLPPVVHVSLGWRHACAASRSGAVFCWGLDTGGAIDGDIDAVRGRHFPPTQVAMPRDEIEGSLQVASEVSTGWGYSAALSETGRVVRWGFAMPGVPPVGEAQLVSGLPPVRKLSEQCVVSDTRGLQCWPPPHRGPELVDLPF